MSSNVTVTADRDKNCLYVALEGFFDLESAKSAVDEVSRELGKLQRGFAVINDMSGMKAASAEVTGEVGRALKLVENAGVGTVYRVVSDASAIAKIQHSRLQRETGVTYEVVEVDSVEEAERRIKAT